MVIAAANSGKVTEGSISTVVFKDPDNPSTRSDKGIKLYRSIMSKYAKGSSASDVYNVYAMAVAYTMVDVLKKAGKEPTRKSAWNAALRLNEKGNPFLLPGVVVKTSAKDHFPIEQARLEIWRNGRWAPLGPLVAASS
jgi:hypothetical protein